MEAQGKNDRIEYVKPQVLDLGTVTAIYGACSGGLGFVTCDPAGSIPGGGTCQLFGGGADGCNQGSGVVTM